MKILLVEPEKRKEYHTSYPPLALLKLAAYHKKRGDLVKLAKGSSNNSFIPDKIYITSLFTYAWEPVHEVIRFYSDRYKKAKVIVGGIYATLCPDHLRDAFKKRIKIHKRLFKKIDNILPDYSVVPEWDASIVFSSRGCIRKCSFCSVNKLEPKFEARKSIKKLIYPGHKKIIFWDNNILASPYWRDIFDEVEDLNLEVDFNQGLDARLLTEEIALRLKGLKIPLLRLAYDTMGIRKHLQKAIALLKDVGFRGRRIIVYSLFNHENDNPDDFLLRIKELLEWGVVAYPMRYEPLEPMPKNSYVSPNWTAEQLNMIQKARRVIGYGGAFPPYDGLRKKITRAKTFEQAFKLRRIQK
ncbi:MAG: hypothetical protein AMJ73_00945 [candidate division Zixibacteria bacterium SM1_73]|nr:MAG: hypothetical protein AMJ73_00945 [candidate division Zixibacteria bacterium SM1_73]